MIEKTKAFEAALEQLINSSGLPITVVRLELERMAMIASSTERELGEKETKEEIKNEH